MILTEDNLQEWKECLSKEMKEQHNVPDYGNTLSDNEWIKDYLGDDTQLAIEEEVECWDSPEFYD